MNDAYWQWLAHGLRGLLNLMTQQAQQGEIPERQRAEILDLSQQVAELVKQKENA